jgi:hypothetical protein
LAGVARAAAHEGKYKDADEDSDDPAVLLLDVIAWAASHLVRQGSRWWVKGSELLRLRVEGLGLRV